MFSRGSLCWRDLGKISSAACFSGTRWLEESCKTVIGSGREVRFWHDMCLGEEKLSDSFGGLFTISENKEAMVSGGMVCGCDV